MWYTRGLMPSFFIQPDAAHAEEDFLFDPDSLVGAIQALRYFSILNGISRNIGIQQV